MPRFQKLKYILGFYCVGIFACAPAVLALEDTASASFNLPVIEKTLKNGLKVLVVEKPGVPLVSFSYIVPVGAQDAPQGKTGLPHMLEHMMFKGTQTIGTHSYQQEKPLLAKMDRIAVEMNREKKKKTPSAKRLEKLAGEMKKVQETHRKLVVKDELSSIYTRNGGDSLNAWTSQDATNYHVTLPANKVALYAAVEKDRLSRPVFREFYSERDVVAQERRWRYESRPDGKIYEALQSTAFTKSPYKNPTIGWMADIQGLLRLDADEFYKRCYRPDRGVLAVVGGIRARDVLPLLEKNLGKVPNPKVKPVKLNRIEEPIQQGQREVNVEFDADPVAVLAWHMPNFPDPDAVSLDILSSILTNGNTSRLMKRLVFDGKMVTSISSATGFPGDRNPTLFVLEFNPAPGQTLQKVIAAFDEEIQDIRKNGVTREELDRARRIAESSFLWGKTTTEGLAQDLAYNQAVHGDWRYVEKYLEMVRGLTIKDIRYTAMRYLINDNRTIATLERPKDKTNVQREDAKTPRKN